MPVTPSEQDQVPQNAAAAAAMQQAAPPARAGGPVHQAQAAPPSVPSAGDAAAAQKAADAAKAPAGGDMSSDIEAMKAERDRLREELEAAGRPQTGRFTVPTVMVRVLPPHSEMHHGGAVIGRDWTEVPEHLSAALQGAARDSGVQIEQKEE